MNMRKAILMMLATLLLATSTAWAAETVVRGVCTGMDGKPVVGGSVELTNLDNGQKITLKLDEKGQYLTVGTKTGRYRLTLLDASGKRLFTLEGIAVNSGAENTYDLDVAKEVDRAMTPEQRAAREKVLKTNEKIKKLNQMLVESQNLRKEGKIDEAVATMEQAVALDQTHDVVYAVLGECYMAAKKYPEAQSAYEKALTLVKPDSKETTTYHSGLALALMKQSKASEGLAECAKIQGNNAVTAQCYYNGGAVLTNAGKIDEANQAFDQSIIADPTRAESYYQKGVNLMGKATLKNGKMVPAPGTAAAFNKYLELAPDGPYAQPAKDMLTAIGASVQTTYGVKKGHK